MATASLNATLDTNEAFDQAKDVLTSFVNGGKGQSADPEQFTKATVQHFTSQGLNVMCIHNTQNLFSGDKRVTKQNIEVSTSFVTTKGFSVYVAPKGCTWTVTNTGDGGFTNWAFGGTCERSGSTVTFH